MSHKRETPRVQVNVRLEPATLDGVDIICGIGERNRWIERVILEAIAREFGDGPVVLEREIKAAQHVETLARARATLTQPKVAKHKPAPVKAEAIKRSLMTESRVTPAYGSRLKKVK